MRKPRIRTVVAIALMFASIGCGHSNLSNVFDSWVPTGGDGVPPQSEPPVSEVVDSTPRTAAAPADDDATRFDESLDSDFDIE